VSPAPSPAPGPDGDEPPLPANAARDDAGPPPLPGPPAEDDYDAGADLARLLDDIDSGRVPIPSEEELHPPVVMFAFGQTADVDPVLLAAMAGPDGLGGQAFGQDQMADVMPPGPLLAALTENAAAGMGGLSDDALLGVMSAVRRLAARAEYLELAAIAEFSDRRQQQLDASIARKDPRGQRAGEFPDSELGMHLQISGREAGNRMDQATALATRLPRTFAGLAAGAIDPAKAHAIWFYTRFLSDADVGHADEILAAAAPGIKADSLAARAARLEMKLDPEAARARKEHARRESRRVETRRELSGNMSYGGRELAVEEAVAASKAIEAEAEALHRAGMEGSIRELQVRCFLDRLLGRNPFDRLRAPAPGDPAADSPRTDHPGTDHPGTDHRGTPSSPAVPADPDGDPEPFPALINLLVPVGTQLGWSTAPGQLGRWGLLDPWDTRRLVQAASKHSRTRWCVTAVGPDGTAVAHGCSRGPHRWTPQPPATATNTKPGTTRPPPGPDQHQHQHQQQQQQLAALLRALNITLEPIAKGTCDHRHRENRYKPSRKLGHLVRARTATCPAPGCGASAYHADLDHTIPWPTGETDECNISPPCRRHHRVKQAPGWKLEQKSPGVMRWTAPSGRTYTTTPTVYDL
jgi:hypothetical protein